MTDYLLDTNVIVDFLRGKPGTVELLSQIVSSGHLLHSCEITVAEVFSGMKEKERAMTEEFLNSLKYLPMEQSQARKAGELRQFYLQKGKTLPLADTLIASLAIHHNMILLTENLKDYPMPELKKERPS